MPLNVAITKRKRDAVRKAAAPFSSNRPDRTLDPGELARAVRLDIIAEQEAIALYEAHADATDDAAVAGVLRSIADEEKVHVGELQRLLERILDPRDASLRADGEREADDLLGKPTRAGLAVRLGKAAIEGYYRTSPSGERVWVAGHSRGGSSMARPGTIAAHSNMRHTPDELQQQYGAPAERFQQKDTDGHTTLVTQYGRGPPQGLRHARSRGRACGDPARRARGRARAGAWGMDARGSREAGRPRADAAAPGGARRGGDEPTAHD